MQIVHTQCILFELCVKEKERKKNRRTRTKSKCSHSIFSTVIRINGILEVYFTLEKIRVSTYRSFALLRCVYLGAAPIPKVQHTILSPPNCYLRSTIALLVSVIHNQQDFDKYS